jgi:hypothetical protein
MPLYYRSSLIVLSCKGDRLFRNDNRSELVMFSQQLDERTIHIWDGCIIAGNALVEAACSSLSGYERDSLIYPILNNYRHGVPRQLFLPVVLPHTKPLLKLDLSGNRRFLYILAYQSCF